MIEMPSVEQLISLIGAKEIELVMLRLQTIHLSQRVAELEKQVKPDGDGHG